MRINVEINDLTAEQWEFLQENLRTEYGFEPGEPRACVTFLLGLLGREERHVEMPPWALTRLLRLLAAQPSVETMPKRLPTLPTPEQVRGLTAAEAVKLAQDTNELKG